jgi:hypothetical protein
MQSLIRWLHSLKDYVAARNSAIPLPALTFQDFSLLYRAKYKDQTALDGLAVNDTALIAARNAGVSLRLTRPTMLTSAFSRLAFDSAHRYADYGYCCNCKFQLAPFQRFLTVVRMGKSKQAAV